MIFFPPTNVSATTVTGSLAGSSASASLNAQPYRVAASVDCFLAVGTAATSGGVPLYAKSPEVMTFAEGGNGRVSVSFLAAGAAGTIFFTPVS